MNRISFLAFLCVLSAISIFSSACAVPPVSPSPSNGNATQENPSSQPFNTSTRGAEQPISATPGNKSPDNVTISTPTSLPAWVPVPGDELLDRGEAFIDQTGILVLESFPPQFLLSLQGTLPTPCHQLRVEVMPPDSQNRIQAEAYSLVQPTAICIQVLEPFQAQIPLKDLPPGKYTVWVNEERVGEIEVPNAP